MFWRLWYIQNNGTVSTGGLSIKTGNELIFDFINNDYAVFLNNNSTGTLFFNLRAYTTSGSWVYINGIDDSDTLINRFLWNDIIIDSDGKYMSNQFQVIWLK